MSKRIGALAAIGAVVMLSAGCGDGDPAPTWEEPAPAAPSAAASTAPKRPARITSACDLLPATVVIDVLGGNEKTKLSGRELPREKTDNGNVWRHCAYGQGANEPFQLSVGTMPDRANTVEETIEAVREAGGKEAALIDGLGAGAVGYVEGQGRLVMAVTTYQKELRAVQFSAPAMVPQDKLVDVVRQVIGKI